MRIRIRNLAENSQQIWIVARVRNRSDLLRLRFQFLLWKSFGSGSGSGSGSGCGLVPVPDPDLFSTALQKYLQNLAFSMIEAVLFPRKFVSNFDFWTFILNFMLDRVQIRFPNRNRMHYSSGSARAKRCGSCGSGSVSGSTTLIVSIIYVMSPHKNTYLLIIINI